jgi:DNA-binding IclR family transcriptional regulator
LSPADVDGIIAEYDAGARTTDLAKQFCVHRNTVQRLLKTSGVVLRHGPDRRFRT